MAQVLCRMQVAVDELRFDEKGLIASIVVEESTKEVLMCAYMNKDAIAKSLEIGELVFYSRSRQQLWHKGSTSGNYLQIKTVRVDCDYDTLLFEVKVLGKGVACHTGSMSCFFNELSNEK